jgi:hypothetical protein
MQFFLLLLLIQSLQAQAFPDYLKQYKAHPLAKPELAKCGLCHVAPGGGGERNEFGKAFHEEGFEFGPELIKNFAQKFKAKN